MTAAGNRGPAADAPENQPGGVDQAGSRKSAVILAAGLSVALVVLGALLVWIIYATNQVQSDAAAEVSRGEATEAAAEQVPLMFGYNHITVRDEMDTALEGLTGEFRDTFEEEANTKVIPRAEENEVVSEATVVAQGAVETTADTATVLVYFNQVINANTGPKATFTPSRLLVDMQKVDGRWLVSGLEAI